MQYFLFSYLIFMDLVALLNSYDTGCLYFGNKFNFYINICISCLSNEAKLYLNLFLCPERLTYSKRKQILIKLNFKINLLL